MYLYHVVSACNRVSQARSDVIFRRGESNSPGAGSVR